MRRLIASAITITSLTFAVAAGAAAAWADGCSQVGEDGICLTGGSPGKPSGGSGGGTGSIGSAPASHAGSGGAGCHDQGGKSIPCENDYGYTWLGSHNCYGFRLGFQPDPDSPLWEGQDPAKGSIWSCDPTISLPENTWFVANNVGGGAPPPPVVDAAARAQELLKRAPFEVAQVHTAPARPHKTYVGLGTWLWIPQDQWHDVSVKLTGGGATVTLTAIPSRVGWDMGDGAGGTSCDNPGRPWADGMTDAAQTSCSYTYERLSTVTADGGYDAHRAFTVTGGLFYDVGWTCTGNCSAPNGDLGEYPAPTSSADLVVTERQSVVTN